MFRNRKYNLILFFSHLPAKISMGFQSAETNYLFSKFENCVNASLNKKDFKIRNNYCHTPRKKFFKFFIDYLKYVKIFPNTKGKFVLIDLKKKYKANLAYGIFLNNTYMYLPFFEKNNIPFIFTLYPGGGFSLNNPVSDEMLKSIFASKMFRKVIVTMPITRDYLINNNFCPIEKIEYIYGTIIQSSVSDINYDKKYYKKDKDTFDICFVAHKYTPIGEDKGYDVFIETAKKIISLNNEVHFHIIGPWDKNIINIEGFENQIHFYGLKNKEFFKDFYSKMDIFISPNRFQMINLGNFDGFPLGAEAAVAGVYLMAADPLNMKPNTPFKDFKELEVIDINSDKISKSILNKLENLDDFYKKSKILQRRFIEIFNYEKQLEIRKSVIESELNKNYE